MDLQLIPPGASVLKVNARRSSQEPKTEGTKSLYQACQEFESVFLAYLLKNMRKTVPRAEFMNGGLREDMYLSMMDEEIARVVAKGPGTGLAASIYRQLSQDKNI
ncbi:rod-binding protein [Candidatus Poribacteria bacterium]